MPGTTDNFLLAFFDFGDNLADPLNISKEISRFTIIDRQLYGMASIFGDGTISGWDITDAGDLNVNISSGVGSYNKKVIESFFPETLESLAPNSVLNIYAVPGSTAEIDSSLFFLATPELRENALFLGTVTTGGTNIESIDITGRELIGFKQIIANEIAKHRHNGTSPKIDLEEEVQGELPTSRMADIDASKITSGTIPTKVLPTINHNQLKNIGSLTHPQLDSIANSIQKDNIALMGEIATINLLKLVLNQKYVSPNVDKYFLNELAIIPGISPDKNIDYINSNAYINTTDHCISGVPELPLNLSTGLIENPYNTNNTFEIINIIWNTDEQFRKESLSITNLTINDGVRISTDSVYDRIIEDFEGVVDNNVSNYDATLNLDNTTRVVYSSTHTQGDSAAKFETFGTKNMSFVREFTQSQDWRDFDELNIFIKNTTDSHSSVTMNLYNTDNDLITSFQILAVDEKTEDKDGLVGFAKKQIDISGVTRSDIKKIEFETSDIEGETESFLIDTIYLSSNTFLLPQGNIRFRKDTSAPVIFNSIEYDANIPSGCDLRVRCRIASSLEELINASYTSLLQSGESFATTGRYIEIDITLIANTALTESPTLNSVSLQILSPSVTSGLEIKSANNWNNGSELININVNSDSIDDYISMKNTNVNNFYFINNNQVAELDPDGFPSVAINSQTMPVAPEQGYNYINPPDSSNDPYGTRRSDIRGIYKPRSTYRLNNGNYIIADTYNDRILEMTNEGVFVRGFASHNYTYDADNLFALTANYNPRLGVLFITFSKETDVRNFDLTLVRLIIGNNKEIRLSNLTDKVRLADGTIVTDRSPGATNTNPPDNLSGDVDRILTVLLSKDKRDILDSTTLTVQCAISTNIQDQIECFMGDYMYFGGFGIHKPIYANYTSNNNIIVANASILSDSDTVIQTFPVLEFTKRIGEFIDGESLPLGLTFSYDKIFFSDIMLGSLDIIETLTEDGELIRKLLVCGLTYEPNLNSSSSSAIAGDAFSLTLPDLDDKKLLSFRGTVRLIDMVSQLNIFEYKSPDGLYPCDAFIKDNYITIAESSFIPQSGRIVKLDYNGIGDGRQPPIIQLIEGGMFTKIWDIRKLNENNIFVST